MTPRSPSVQSKIAPSHTLVHQCPEVPANPLAVGHPPEFDADTGPKGLKSDPPSFRSDPVSREAWNASAERLADWMLARVFVRTDAFGGYYRKDDKTQKSKRPNRGCGEGFSRTLLIRHLRAAQTEDVIGAYCLTTGESGSGKWVVVDIDAHDEEDDPTANSRYAIHLHNKLSLLGFTPLLLSWGTGGFHLWVFFGRNVPGPTLHSFGKWIVSDSKAFGFKKLVETFPKQEKVEEGKFGNWLRAPGRHHTRDVYASVYNGAAWVEGTAAVERILSIGGDDPRLIPAMGTGVAEPTATTPISPKKVVPYNTDKSDVFDTYNHLVSIDEVASWHQSRGHKVIARQTDRVDFSRDGKKENTESFNVKVIGGVPITYSFSCNAGMPDNRGLNPSQVKCFYRFGRIDTSAMKDLAVELKRELGWDEKPKPSPKPIPASSKSTCGQPPADVVDESPDDPSIAKPADEGQSGPIDPTTTVAIITAFFLDRYKPDFKRGNAVHTESGEIVPMGVACEVPNSKLIEKLAGASDAPRFKGGNVDRDKLPGWFKKWCKVAWGDLLESLPDEDAATLGSGSIAADEFRRLVREAMLAEIVIGDIIGRDDVTRTERRSLIDWCVKWAKPGPWKSIRSKMCWCKVEVLSECEICLKVAIRHELFAQLKADRRLIEMGANTFTRRAAKYGVGTSPRDDRPHGQRAVILTDAFVSDLTAGLVPDSPEIDGQEFDHFQNGQMAA
jgi:hypothetical protein